MTVEDNIEILCQRELNIDKLKFLGISLGESYKDINKELITEINVFQTKWIRTNKNIHFRTENNNSDKVIEVLLKKEILSSLQIQSTSKIITRFGEPKEIEKKNDFHYYFYPEKKMVISWKNDIKELFGIYIGDNIIKITSLTAYDFLKKFYEFKGMVPDKDNWKESELKGNPPRFYRLLELKSLMKAFNLGSDLLKDFENKDFLERRKPIDFEPIYKDIEVYAKNDETENKRFDRERMRKRGVRLVFNQFMKFSETIRNTLNFNSGWLEAGSGNARYTIDKTSQLLNTINTEKLKEIEELIVLIIDPEKQSFTKGELIRNYNYPDIDLQKIDFEYY